MSAVVSKDVLFYRLPVFHSAIPCKENRIHDRSRLWLSPTKTEKKTQELNKQRKAILNSGLKE